MIFNKIKKYFQRNDHVWCVSPLYIGTGLYQKNPKGKLERENQNTVLHVQKEDDYYGETTFPHWWCIKCGTVISVNPDEIYSGFAGKCKGKEQKYPYLPENITHIRESEIGIWTGNDKDNQSGNKRSETE